MTSGEHTTDFTDQLINVFGCFRAALFLSSEDKVERPKKDRYVGSFYDADEVNALFEAAKGTKLELPILFGAFYGLRRSEAIGLKWDAIDFDQNTITIRHTVTSCDLDGKRILVAADTTKTKSGFGTLKEIWELSGVRARQKQPFGVQQKSPI